MAQETKTIFQGDSNTKWYLDTPYQDITLSQTSADLSQDVINLVLIIKPAWKGFDLKTRVFTDGISNKLIGCYHGEKISNETGVLVRINGVGTEKIINRDSEILTFNLLSGISCLNTAKLFTVFCNGLCYEYLDGDTLDEASVRDPHIAKKIAIQMANMHSLCSCIPLPLKSEIGAGITKFIANFPERFDDENKQKAFEQFPKISQLESEIRTVVCELEKLKLPIVLCHSDLLLANILYDKTQDKIQFIDFEYSAYNFNCFDIGNHFTEYAGMSEVDYSRYPDKDYQMKWLRNYLEQVYSIKSKDPKSITPAELNTLYVGVNLSALAAHLYWALWSVYQAYNSAIDFDFLSYGKLRIDEYYSKKDAFFALLATID